MAAVNFRLRSKANKNVSIKVYTSLGRGNLVEVSTGFTINPNDWSEKTDRPKQNSPQNKSLFIKLKKLESFLFDNINNDMGRGVMIDAFWLIAKIDECFGRLQKTETGLLVNHTQYIIDNAATRQKRGNTGLSKETIKSYVSFRKVVLEYQKEIKKQILFTDLTAPFVEKFKIWMLNEKKYAKNTAGRKLQMLKTICVDAEQNEIPVTPYSKKIEHFGESKEDRHIQTLSFAELTQIKDVDLSNVEYLNNFKRENPELTKGLLIEPERLDNVRKWILFGCEIGQRGGDLLKITPDNIRYTAGAMYLDLIQQKTKKEVTIGIIAPHVIDIIENGFPFAITHQKLNDYSKVVCKLAGIEAKVKGSKLNIGINRKEFGVYPKYELIASHCFRRSFCSNYYKKIPTPVLMGISGHSKESLFLTYINKPEDKDENANLFMKFYNDLHKNKAPEMKVIHKTGTK